MATKKTKKSKEKPWPKTLVFSRSEPFCGSSSQLYMVESSYPEDNDGKLVGVYEFKSAGTLKACSSVKVGDIEVVLS